MSFTIVNATGNALPIGTGILGPYATLDVSGYTPEISAMLSAGLLQLGGTPPEPADLTDLSPSSLDVPITILSASILAGVTGHDTIVGGSGGADGTYSLGFTGGTGVAATGTFNVSGGTVTDLSLTSPGQYTVAPSSFDFSACPGLTGESVPIQTGAVATQIAAPMATRLGWQITNTSGSTLYFSEDGTPATFNSTAVDPTETYQSPDGFATTNAISVYGPTVGLTFTASEW